METRSDGTALVDPDAGRIRLKIGGDQAAKATVRSGEGLWLARLLTNDTLVVYDARDGAERARFDTLAFVKPPPLDPNDPFGSQWWDEDRCVVFAAEDRHLVLAKGHRATELWSIDPAERIALLALEPGAPVTALDISADGAWIATGDERGRIAVWSAVDGELARDPWQISGRVNALHFDPTGARIAVGSPGCVVRVLELDDGSMRELLMGRLIGTDSNLGIADVRFDPTGSLLVALSRTCGPKVCAWKAGSWVPAWETDVDVSWNGQATVRFREDGARLLVGGPGIALDASEGAILCQPFPIGADAYLDTDGECAWSLAPGILRLYTFEPCVRIRDVRLD